MPTRPGTDTTGTPGTPEPARSVKMSLEGKRLELVDHRRVEVYGFGEGGVVSVTLGRRNGLIAGSVFHWRLADDGAVVISHKPCAGAFETLFVTDVEGDRLTVTRKTGTQVTFTMSERPAGH